MITERLWQCWHLTQVASIFICFRLSRKCACGTSYSRCDALGNEASSSRWHGDDQDGQNSYLNVFCHTYSANWARTTKKDSTTLAHPFRKKGRFILFQFNLIINACYDPKVEYIPPGTVNKVCIYLLHLHFPSPPQAQ